jgi:hypothetical protein
MNATEEIEITEVYKGVGIHADQPRERIERTVKPAIDEVQRITTLEEWAKYAGDCANPPEARLLAAAMCKVTFEIARNERRRISGMKPSAVAALVVGLNIKYWRDRNYYCSLFDVWGPGSIAAVPREQRLEDTND